MGRRLLLLDNLKSLKFSSAALEGMLTSETISGRQLYKGEGRRPNTLVVVLTVNGAVLSKDMAQRCVIVELARPRYSAGWEDQAFTLVRERRWEIIGDCLARLREEPRPLQRIGRWGRWEREVLARTGDPAACQEVLRQRRDRVDGDAQEVDVVRAHFLERLRDAKIDPDAEKVILPSALVGRWVNEATQERMSVPKACSHLGRLALPELRQGKHRGGRVWIWTGPEWTPADEVRSLDAQGCPVLDG